MCTVDSAGRIDVTGSFGPFGLFVYIQRDDVYFQNTQTSPRGRLPRRPWCMIRRLLDTARPRSGVVLLRMRHGR